MSNPYFTDVSASAKLEATRLVDQVRAEVEEAGDWERPLWLAKSYLARLQLRDGVTDRAALIGALARLMSSERVTQALGPQDIARVLLTDVALQRHARDCFLTMEASFSWRAPSLAAFLTRDGDGDFSLGEDLDRDDLRNLAFGRFDLVGSSDLASRCEMELMAACLPRACEIEDDLGALARPQPSGLLQQMGAFFGLARQTPVPHNDPTELKALAAR